jgi:ssDNA-binding Zn-finger/Zn-ribbon topoisomerase 1
VKNEAGEPSCSTIINLDKEGKPLPPKAPPIKTTVACEKCGSPMLLRDSKRGPFLGCSSFPKCRSTKMAKKLEGDDAKQVEALLPLLSEGAEKAREMAAKITGSIPAGPASGAAQAGGGRDRHRLRRVRQADDDPLRPSRPVPRCSGYPKCKNTGEVPAKLMEELGLNNVNGNARRRSRATRKRPSCRKIRRSRPIFLLSNAS